MESLDLVIVIMLALGAIVGFMKGFIKQVISMVGLIAGLLVARALFGAVGEKLAVQVGTSVTFGQILAFFLIWIIVPIGLSIVASILTKVVSMVKLGFVNRWLGSGIGLIKYGLLVSMFINLIEFVDSNNQLIFAEKKQASVMYYPMQRFAGVFAPAFKTITKTVKKQLLKSGNDKSDSDTTNIEQ